MRPAFTLITAAACLFSASTVLANGPTNGPSFSCQRPLSPAEAKICATPVIAEADRELADLYERLKARVTPRSDVAPLVEDQKDWLRLRDACTSTRCFLRAYDSRRETLAMYAMVHAD